MSLIGIGIAVAAVTMMGGAVAALLRRKSRPALANHGAVADAVAHRALAASQQAQMRPPLVVGDVVQFGLRARWSQGALVGRDHEGIAFVALLSQDGAEQQVTVAFAPPERSILWLTPHHQPAQVPAPTRIEVDRQLLDRRLLLSLTINSEGDAPRLAGNASVAIYDGPLGEAAVIFHHSEHSALWCGQRVAPDEWERLANVPD